MGNLREAESSARSRGTMWYHKIYSSTNRLGTIIFTLIVVLTVILLVRGCAKSAPERAAENELVSGYGQQIRFIRLTREDPIDDVELESGEVSDIYSAIGADKFGWGSPNECVGVSINRMRPIFDCPYGKRIDVNEKLGSVGAFRTLQFVAPSDTTTTIEIRVYAEF